MRLRRPSLPLIVAFLALFVALDGPVQAQRFIEGKLRKGSVGTREVKNRSLAVKDLRRKTVRRLRRTPNSSVTEAKLRNGSVTPGKLAPGAVGSAAIADDSITAADLAPSSVGGREIAAGAVTGAHIADGSLAANDLGRFSGRFGMRVGPVPANECWTATQPGLAPERAGADISRDLVVVNPDSMWPEEELSLTVQNSARPDRFAITACNVTGGDVEPFDVELRYLVIDLP